MKNFLFTIGLVVAAFLAQATAAEPLVVYLVDEDDYEMIDLFESEGLAPSKVRSEQDAADLLEERRDPLNDRHRRIAAQVEERQARFIHLLDRFLDAELNPIDPGSNPEFVEIVRALTRAVFRAETELLYWDRLYLINQLWLDYPDEFDRFRILDQALSQENMKIEERRKLLMEITTAGGAAVGALGIGYLSFKASAKMLPIITNEVSWALVLKWLGRGTVIFVGASVGASLGAYVGFLGGDALLARRHDYIRAIDGDEDLRDILDIIDQMSGLNFLF